MESVDRGAVLLGVSPERDPRASEAAETIRVLGLRWLVTMRRRVWRSARVQRQTLARLLRWHRAPVANSMSAAVNPAPTERAPGGDLPWAPRETLG